MLPEHDRGRPGERRPRNVVADDIHSFARIADKAEQRRRERLRRDLYRAADRLTPFDLPAAALARAWAREVA